MILFGATLPSLLGETSGGDEKRYPPCSAFLDTRRCRVTCQMTPTHGRRTYPRLMASSRIFGERPEDLAAVRYLAAVLELIPMIPDASAASGEPPAVGPLGPLCEVGQLCAILSAVQHEQARILVEEAWVKSFQRHCASVLVAGVQNGFIRVRMWLELAARLGRTSLACPHVAVAICWALTHYSRPFGPGADLRAACALWLVLAKACPAWVVGAAGSSALMDPNMLIHDDGGCEPSTLAKMLDPKALERCVSLGRDLGLDMAHADEWPGILQSL